jgi:hypothetical protein
LAEPQGGQDCQIDHLEGRRVTGIPITGIPIVHHDRDAFWAVAGGKAITAWAVSGLHP